MHAASEPRISTQQATLDELSAQQLETVLAGKGGNSNGGNSPLTRMRARLLDEISIHLVDA